MAVIENQRLYRMVAVINPQLLRIGDTLRCLPMPVLRKFATVSLLAYCCYLVAGLFWMLVPVPELARPDPGQLLQIGAPASAEVKSVVDIQALKAMHLFGDGKQDDLLVAQQPPAIVAEETRLDLLLLGLVVSDVESSGRAVIAHRNKQELFAVGEALPGGNQVTLHQVLPGRVIISNAGRYESLWLYEEAVGPAGRLLAQTVNPPSPKSNTKPVEPDAPPAALPVPSQIIDDPRTLADIIKFTPVHADGRVLGYRVAPGRAPQFFDRAGLKHNDVITSVNGVTLDDPTRALKIYRQLQGERSASFEVVRDGKATVVEVQLDGQRGRG